MRRYSARKVTVSRHENDKKFQLMAEPCARGKGFLGKRFAIYKSKIELERMTHFVSCSSPKQTSSLELTSHFELA